MTRHIRNTGRRIMLLSLILFSLTQTLSAADSQAIPALSPEPQSASWAQSWWMPRHKEKLAEAKERLDKIQLLFIGDSITHSWEKKGKPVWDEYYARRHAFNFGFQR